MALKERKRRFVQEWVVDYNGTRAAIRAGYAAKNAASTASRLLQEPEVRKLRDELLKQQEQELGLTKSRIITELWGLYERCACAKPVLEWDSEAHEYVETDKVHAEDLRGALKALSMLSELVAKAERESEDWQEEEMGAEELFSGETARSF